MNDMEVVELLFHTTHEASDILAFWLHEAGALGVTIVDPVEIREDLARPDSLDYAGQDFLDSLPPTVVLTAWFYQKEGDILIQEEAGAGLLYAEKAPVKINKEAFLSSLEERLNMLHEESDEVRLGYQSSTIVLPEAWQDNWKQYQKPMRIGKNILVVPTWHEGEVEGQGADDVEIRLDAGMAFGSGSHETTANALTLLESEMTPGARVLDLGTGSGILAIAAKKLGASEVVAVDIDPGATKTARENAKTNEVDMEIKTGTIDDIDDRFDLIVANIIYDVLIRLYPDFYRLLKDEGTLIVSGLLRDKADDYVYELEAYGFHCSYSIEENDWCSLLFEKVKREDSLT